MTTTNGVIAMFALVGTLAVSPVLTALNAQDPWGDPVHGLQLGLSVAANAPPPLPGDLPPLELRLRNNGPAPVTFSPELLVGAAIEIDGVWHAQIMAGGSMHRPAVEPESISQPLSLRYVKKLMFELDTRPARPASFGAGRHRVRVRSMPIPNRAFSFPGEPDASVVLISNTIDVEIVALSTAEERRVLSDAVSRGGPDGIEAIDVLGTRYPDAVLPAITHAMEIAPDENRRCAFIRMTSVLPDDAAVGFLIGQLRPEVALSCQLEAADALSARNRAEWLPPIVEAWQTLQRRQALSPAESQPVIRLMSLLAQSRLPAAIDALILNDRASVDLRLGVVETFLPPMRMSSRQQSAGGTARVSISTTGSMKTLPDETSAAIERLLTRALDDTGALIGLTVTDDDGTFANPRVCDMAAFVLSRRWPDRYRFTWPSAVAQRDAQIAAIRIAAAR